MNLSNDILFKGVSAFIDAIATEITTNVLQEVASRIDAIDSRMQKLEDRFDHLETASDDRIEQICDQRIEGALESYDPSEALDDGDLAQRVLESYTFQDGVKDAVKELNFTVEVH